MDIINKIQSELSKKLDQFIESEVRKNAFPKITGKITKGKLRWRGLKLVQQGDSYWVEQRGKKISQVVLFNNLKHQP